MTLLKKLPVVILSGGFGSRLDNLTKTVPKPLVRLDRDPIIYHILKIFVKQGLSRFYLATGYKYREFFNYFKKKGGYQVKIIKRNKIIRIELEIEKVNCIVHLIYTGQNTMTGGRLKKIGNFIKDDIFFLTYGDGLANVNLKKIFNFHKKNKRLVTVTAVNPPARFGELQISGSKVKNFSEKKSIIKAWINGGFFLINKKFLKLIKNKNTILEREPLEEAARINQLSAYKHSGFWQCMDTRRDRDKLINMVKNNEYPWFNI
jgi:glucose-1-phosphate cytidylyltransferase